MLRRFSRGSRFTGLVLLALGLAVISACAQQALTSAQAPGVTAAQATPSFTAQPLIAVSPVLATAPATSSAKADPGEHAKPTAPAANASGSAGGAMARAQQGGYGASSGTTGSTVWGISAPELLTWSTSEQVQQLEAMKATGITTVRLDASWYNTMAGGPDSYNWAPLDAVMSSIQKVGLTADLIIDGCPAWAAVSGAAGSYFAQPSSPAQYASFAAAVAQRYGNKGAKYFEIWNEPNNPVFWVPSPDPAAYTADLKAAYPAIKAVDPSAVVLTAGLAPQANSSNSYDIVTFFEDMYADGAHGNFDGVGDHPYTYPYTPSSQTLGSAWSEMSQTSTSLRSLMIAHGDGDKKIWITEYGAPTGAAGVTEAQQSDEISQAMAAVKRCSWIGSFYIYSWEDGGSDTFGLLNSSGGQKPAYTAVVAALH